jgi:serine/threonine-protein kinase
VVADLARKGGAGAGPLPLRSGDRPPGTGRGLPRSLRTILARCLEERPQDRYPSAGELAEDLRRYLDGEPLLAQRGGWRRNLRRRLRAHRLLVAALGLFLVLGVGAGAWFARRSVQKQRQVALAQRLAQDTRDLESALRIERLIPRHDLRLARARWYERLAAIREDLARLGPGAAGPGNLALGRGYLALGDLDQALQCLEVAGRTGYGTARVACALVRTHCAWAMRLASFDRRGGADPSQAAQRAFHLRAARAQFERFQTAGGMGADLEEAALLVQEGAFEAGLAKARAAFREAPWLYEAKVEQARALAGLAGARAAGGDPRVAASLFREAELAAQEAVAIGQSDEAAYLAELDGQILRLDHLPPGPGAEAAAWGQAERLADQALELDPDHPQALDAKVYVVLRRAGARLRAGQDPRPDLDRAERYLAPWEGDPALATAAALRRRWIHCLRAGFRMARNEDPGGELEWALDDPRGGIWTLEALVMGGRWAVRRGRDPGPWLRAFRVRQEDRLPEPDQPRRAELLAQVRHLRP